MVAPRLPAIRDTDSLQSRLQSREVRALAALRRGQGARASAEIRHGLDELGFHASRLGSLDLRTASAVHGVSLARLGVELAEQGGSPAELFAAVERGRAISTRMARVGPPADERTAELLSELRRCEEAAPGTRGRPCRRERGRPVARAAGTLQRDIRARAWELEDGTEPVRMPGPRMSEVREAARTAGTAFATFVAHRGRWLAVVASGRRGSVVELAATGEVDELVQRVRADFDALSLPRLPPPIVEAVRRSLDAGLRTGSTTSCSPLSVWAAPRWSCRAARRWCCCPGACSRHGGGCLSS